MPDARGTLVLLGTMGSLPFAGMAWQVLHHLEGFRRLGYEVYYVEDTGTWPYDPDRNLPNADPSYAVRYIAEQMAWLGVPRRWAYVAGSQGGRVYGLSAEELTDALRRADVLVNLTGATVLRDEHRQIPVRIYLETDPILAQIEVARGNANTIDFLRAHTHLFTYGANLGSSTCPIPTGPFHFHPTRPPVVLDWWDTPGSAPSRSAFTTISNWAQSGKDIEWQGRLYRWSKQQQFLDVLDLPRHVSQPLEIALSSHDAEVVALWEAHGWRVADAYRLSLQNRPYRDYICRSRGEFTVAKDQYVYPRSGWFSDRSVCYLAAGKPVVTQDTGFGRHIPTGDGLFAFNTVEEAAQAIDGVNRAYERHSAAASRIAGEYFRAETVLAAMLAAIGEDDVPVAKQRSVDGAIGHR